MNKQKPGYKKSYSQMPDEETEEALNSQQKLARMDDFMRQ